MEPYAYPSHPDSGHSSPRSREIECETAAVAVAASYDDFPPPPTSARVKLMCSYGGRIQPRAHDNKLSYVGGDTKILTIERSIRYSSIVAKLSSILASDDFILKYQLPGEDLDALISVTNDEDLDHMMIEYDRLHRTSSKPVPRLRTFLFAVMGKSNQDSASIVDPSPVVTPKEGPDYLFGLEPASSRPMEVETETEAKDEAPEKTPSEGTGSPAKSDVQTVAPTSVDSQANVQEMQKLQIAEQQQVEVQVSSIQGKGNDGTLGRVSASEYFAPPVQEKALPPFWHGHSRGLAPVPRFGSIVSGDGGFYFFPANPGVYPGSAVPGLGYYAAVQRVIPAPTYDSTAAVYAAAMAAPPPAKPLAYDNGTKSQAVEVSGGCGAPAAASGAYDNGAGYAAYDSAGRAVYYAGMGSTYQTVGGNVAISTESNVLKPSQVS